MTQTFRQLLLEAVFLPGFRLTQRQIVEDFGEAGPVLLTQNWLAPTQSDLYVPCDICGQTHLVSISSDRYYYNCENDETTGLQEVAKAELLGYKFSFEHFASWLAKQIKAEGKVVVIDQDRAWYLGKVEPGGTGHQCYLSLLASPDEVQAQQNRLSSPNVLILWLDKNLHTTTHTQSNLINVLSLLDLQDNGITFDAHLFKSHFTTPTTTQPTDIELDKDIVATDRTDSHFLLLGARQDNTFDHDLRITPMMHNILFHLFQIRTYKPNHKNSQELSAAGLATNARKITESIKAINDLATKHHQKAVIVRLANYHYALNPALDCMQQLPHRIPQT